MTTWLEVARDFAFRRGIAPYAEVLDAFVGPNPRGGPPAPPEEPWTDDFEALERALYADDLDAIARHLRRDVDEAQAQMFGRRLRSVDAALVALADDVGRLLRVGLRQRLRGILAGPPPRAARVRALADFYYSYAGLHGHRRRNHGAASLDRHVRAARWQPIAEGVAGAVLDGDSDVGPVHVNLLRIDPHAVRIEVSDCRDLVRDGEPFEAFVRRRGAIAAISGGFFLYSEPDIRPPSQRHDPVGLLLRDGAVLSPPVFRRGSLLVDAHGHVSIERLGMEAIEVHGPDGSAWSTDRALNRAHARHGPLEPSVAIVGDEIVAVGTDLSVPLNGVVLPLDGAVPPSVGARVRYGPVYADGGRVHAGIAGGPLLLDAGEVAIDMKAEDFWGTAPPVTFSQDETGDHNRLPRLAAGLRPDGTLIVAAIDGRNFDRALGLTLADTARLMAELGCVRATNLDGGSSKRMVVQGHTLDLPTTEILARAGPAPIRPVYTAVLFHRRRAP